MQVLVPGIYVVDVRTLYLVPGRMFELLLEQNQVESCCSLQYPVIQYEY